MGHGQGPARDPLRRSLPARLTPTCSTHGPHTEFLTLPDEVFLRIGGKQHYLWRAVDQHGTVLDILVQSRRSAKAAKRFFTKLLKGLQYVPRVIVTDKLKSYAAAKRTILPGVEQGYGGSWVTTV